jgi:hypothetical protein
MSSKKHAIDTIQVIEKGLKVDIPTSRDCSRAQTMLTAEYFRSMVHEKIEQMKDDLPNVTSKEIESIARAIEIIAKIKESTFVKDKNEQQEKETKEVDVTDKISDNLRKELLTINKKQPLIIDVK